MRQRDRITWGVTIAALVAAVFAVGGAVRWAVVAFAVLCAVALAFQITSQRRLAGRQPLLVFLAIAAGLTALQLIPLPAAVLELLNPTGYELRAASAKLAGDETPAFMPLSADPAGTLFELVKLSSYLALAYVLLRLAAAERGRTRLLITVGAMIGAAAAIGLINMLLEAHTLYGIYKPRHAGTEFLGPLLNRNHFASLLAVGTLLSGGLVLRPGIQTQERLLWSAIGVLCLVESLLIQSRGAAIGLALGLGVFGGLLMLHRWVESARREGDRRPDLQKVTLPVIIVVLCGLTLVIFFSAGGVSSELSRTSAEELSEPLSKFVAWRSGLTLLGESPWVGIGRGGFESAFTRVHEQSGFLTYSHLENEYLQAVVDWGIPGALILAVVAGWIAVVAFRRWNAGPLAAASLAALVTVAAQSMVDFGVELPGLAVPVLVVLVTLTRGSLVESGRTRTARARLQRSVALVALVAIIVLLATPYGTTLHEDHADLSAEDARPSAEFGIEAMRRHPVDYLAVAYVAVARYTKGDISARPLLNHALILHPTHADLHRLAGRLLLRTGNPNQALVEYRLAIAVNLNPVSALRELVQRFPQSDQAIRALPIDHPSPGRVARVLADEQRSDLAVQYLLKVSAERPVDMPTLKLLYSIAELRKDYAATEEAGRRMVQLDHSQESYIALAQALKEQKKYPAAAKAAQRAIDKSGPVSVELEANLLLADVHLAASDWKQARAQLLKMQEQPEIYNAGQREVHRRMAWVEDALGNKRQADIERAKARGP
jgi:O-antigen ligase/tetratricopeptide (TPR) repeat protein